MNRNLIEQSENSKGEEDIRPRIERLVRECLSQHHDLEVINVTNISLLLLGENYCSPVFKLNLSVRKIGQNKKEALALVAKMGPKCGNSFVDWPKAFEKESFVYTVLIPAYQDIEREAGIEEEKLIDILPRYYGAYGNDDEGIDENSILLMENLKVKYFYTVARKNGIDVDHAEKALSALARYHALGIAMKQKRPSIAVRAIKNAKLQPIRKFIIDDIIVGICETFRNCARLSKYENTLKSSLESYKEVMFSKTFEPEEPWATITHGDFWNNNILFYKGKNGFVDDVKLIDFPMFVYASASMDLPYFICTTLSDSVLENDFDQLMNTSYTSFCETLNSVGCDTEPYTRKNFDLELKKQAKVVFSICGIATTFLIFDVGLMKNHEDFQQSIITYETTDAYRRGLIRLVDIYEKRNWF